MHKHQLPTPGFTRNLTSPSRIRYGRPMFRTPTSLSVAFRGLLLFASSALALTPAFACDIATPPQVKPALREKVPHHMVYEFTPQSGIQGHLLHTHIRQRKLPSNNNEHAFFETRIGAAAAALYGRKPNKVSLQGAMETQLNFMKSTVPARSFVVLLDFDGVQIRASGYARINRQRRDIALIFALPRAEDTDRAFAIVKQIAAHPGFDCTEGDSP